MISPSFPHRIFCIGRNYVEHIKELGHPMDQPPLMFLKPASSLIQGNTLPARVNGYTVHYETELVVQIGRGGVPKDEADALGYIAGLGLGLDLTLRDLQAEIIRNGAPWEICKAFDRSAFLTDIVSYDPARDDLNHLVFSLHVNGNLRQSADSSLMIYGIPRTLCEIARYWPLLPGDLIYTGTPKGVDALAPGDVLTLTDHRGDVFTATVENDA